MISARIARRYARALLAIGREDGKAETYKEELAEVAKLLEGQTELEHALSNPLYDAKGRKNDDPGKELKSAEARVILDALKRNNYSRLETAHDLGLHKSTLFRKIKKLGITLPKIDGRSASH